jgi:RNA 3'-terminal phosphate cyclase (ATP)
MALGAGGRFTTTEPSGHTRTNIEVIREFLETEITMKEMGDGIWEVSIENR